MYYLKKEKNIINRELKKIIQNINYWVCKVWDLDRNDANC